MLESASFLIYFMKPKTRSHPFKPLFVVLVLTLLLTSCGKYSVDVTLTPDQVATYELQIAESEAILDAEASTDAEKISAYDTMGFAYQMMGEYKKALDLYEDALRLNPRDFIALNNSAVIYEDVGDIERASRFVLVLYTENPTNQQVVSDFIRIYVELGDTETAQTALESFATWASTQENYDEYTYWISQKFVEINSAEASVE